MLRYLLILSMAALLLACGGSNNTSKPNRATNNQATVVALQTQATPADTPIATPSLTAPPSPTPTPSPTAPPVAKPSGSFSSTLLASPPLTIGFKDTSTGQVSTRSWNFGDGGTESVISPNHTYTAPGDYTVTIKVSGPGGDGTFSRIVVVLPPSTPIPTPVPVTVAPIGAGCPVDFPVKVTAAKQAYDTDHPAYATAIPVSCYTNINAATKAGNAAAPHPVRLQGVGQTATKAVTPPGSVSMVTLTHTGRSNFIVHAFHGTQDDSMVNEIGNYSGARPLIGTDPVVFDVRADGTWTISIDPIGLASGVAFSGKGDAVSGLFDPPATGAWEIAHDGKSNFIVHAVCAGGQVSVQNEIGRISGSRVIQFQNGPCFWEVRADGNWSLKPRQ